MMLSFSSKLQEAKTQLGFKTHKDFYQHLSDRGLSVNYQHFMKLIKGELRPAPELVAQLAQMLPKWSDELTLSYCQELFPKSAHLFPLASQHHPPEVKTPKKTKGAPGSRELSLAQIDLLSKSKEHYFIFILSTLSRRPLNLLELSEYFNKRELQRIIAELISAKILIEVDSGYQTFSSEIRFPAANHELKEVYNTFDQWDMEFGSEMELSPIIQKRFLRRISPRYLALLIQQFDVLFESVRISDDLDTRYNTEVLQLSVAVSKGQLPG